MPRYLVTIAQHVLETKQVVVEAADEEAACDAAQPYRDDPDGFEFDSTLDSWIDTVYPTELEVED